MVYLFISINALITKDVWQHIERLSSSERKHVLWHGVVGCGPSPLRARKRDIPLKEENLQEFGG